MRRWTSPIMALAWIGLLAGICAAQSAPAGSAEAQDPNRTALAKLEAENARLRERLAQTLSDLYDATAAPQREAMLLGFLKDALPDVRLAGLRLVDRRVASNEPVSIEVQNELRTMLGDADPRVRQESAIMVAGLPDGDAMRALLARLAVEDLPSVREALLKALGQLRQGEALPAVLAEISSRYESVSAAAAGALARIAAKVPLDEARRRSASEAVILRYEAIDPSTPEAMALREALLSAMGVLEEESFTPLLAEALRDPSAKVRLAAVGALAKVGKSSAAPALVRMTTDSDRGVRQAAIAALGVVGGAEILPTVLGLTDPAAEADEVVRQQAWEVALALLAGAGEETVFTVAEGLASRPDAVAEQIKILTMLTDRLQANGQRHALPRAQRELARALMRGRRPAEAAVQLASAQEAYAARGDGQAAAVWAEWIDALLAADDPVCVTVTAAQADPAALAEAVRKLMGRLSELSSQEKYLTVILLAGEALDHLADKIPESQRKAVQQLAADAEAKQSAIDDQKVATLAPVLGGEEETARKAAGELVAMSTRAVRPLLAELRKTVAANPSDSKIEQGIVEVLRQISPKLTGYDASASRKAKLELIDAWSKP